MKQFDMIFGHVMVAITPTEVVMLGEDTPVVTSNGQTWAEFTTWANKSFSPHLKLDDDAWMSADKVKARILGIFTPKCANAFKSCGITDWEIFADSVYDDEGRPQAESLYIAIPYVQSI